ncbi:MULTISPECIES: TonB-dependent receptor domain-containing protein [Maribacter]|uniref:TonB-dependent receptor n=1 Tax=Maribacter flavus TaxID=1658664 RepID=A0ABU7IHD4_9FLAO|nr:MULTISPECIES: TonB-dependent receptor [Maribacter]MDC6404951.1 TonB-dependent receptor [Maribacter sp. PR66]MEE1972365.1 TonB-dependent receptor [Maribacter flavus]
MRLFFTLMLWTTFGFGYAQSITGKVLSQEQEAIPYATVTLNQLQDSSLVKAVITNEQGFFEIKDAFSGTYILNISNIGFVGYSKTILVNDTSLDLGVIILEAATENLDEVTVVAEKPMVQVLADKTVFNVEKTINVTGTSAFELLRKAPGVVIDNNGGLIVEGKAGVQIFIDNRPSVLQGQDLTNYLESLQSTDIEAIEIITQPSSKYDAAGNAGIINIKLKKDKSLGINGSVTSGITIGDFARYNSSINFNSRGKRGNLYGTYSNRYGKSSNFLNLLRTQSGTQFNARTNSIYDQNSNNVKLGYDFYANQKSTIGAIFNGNFNNGFGNNNSRTPIRPVANTANDSVLVSNNRTTNTTYNINANLNYKYADTLGHTLNMDFDYGRYSSDRTALQPNVYFNGDETQVIRENATSQNTPTDIAIITYKADYEQDLFKGKLGLGFKFSYVNTANTFDFFNQINGEFVLNTMQSNQFDYTEKINAAYINYNYKWEKWNLQMGLRAENTVSDGNLVSNQQNGDSRVERSYTNFFPSGGLTFQLNQKNQLALIYSKRIQRPNYQSLNPFEYVIDELSFSKGNPFLQPQYTDNIKFSHTYNYRLTTSLSYSYVSDFFAQVTVAEGESRNFLTTRNVADQEIVNLGISYPKQVKEWWNIYFSLNAYVSNYKANSPEFLPVKQETLSIYAQNTFNLPRKYTLEVSGWYSSPSVWGGTYRTSALGSLNLAFQKRYFKEKLTARLAFNDILYTVPWRGTTQFGDLFIEGSGGSDSRQVAFSLTYDFGRDEIKKARNRKTGLEDEKDRIGN